MHGLIRAAMAAGLLVLLFASSTSAAVGFPTNVYIADASFTFVDHGVEWSGNVHVIDDRLNGVFRASAFFDRQGPQRLCYAGTPDEFVSNDSIEFFGERYRIDAAIRDDLSSAKLEVAASGQRVTVDGCTGEITSSRPERHTFEAKLTGIGEITTETSDTFVLLPDGTIVPATSTTSSRPADGKVAVDRIDAVVTDAGLLHAVTLPN